MSKQQRYGLDLGCIGIPNQTMAKGRKSTQANRVNSYLELVVGSILGTVIIAQLLGALF